MNVIHIDEDRNELLFILWVDQQKMCDRNVLNRLGKFALGLLRMPESLRLGKDQPAIFSQDDAFVFQLPDQSGEVLWREGKQLGQFPMFQGDR